MGRDYPQGCNRQWRDRLEAHSSRRLTPPTIRSAAKATTGKTGQGNPYLKGVLGTAAAITARTDTFLCGRYRPARHTPGKLKALVAVSRSILIGVWHLLNDPSAPFHGLPRAAAGTTRRGCRYRPAVDHPAHPRLFVAARPLLRCAGGVVRLWPARPIPSPGRCPYSTAFVLNISRRPTMTLPASGRAGSACPTTTLGRPSPLNPGRRVGLADGEFEDRPDGVIGDDCDFLDDGFGHGFAGVGCAAG
jgi:hypothetical protein